MRELYGDKVDRYSTQEILNGLRGPENWEPRNHPPVDYSEVDPVVFEYLEGETD